jgi:hypothetical protein
MSLDLDILKIIILAIAGATASFMVSLLLKGWTKFKIQKETLSQVQCKSAVKNNPVMMGNFLLMNRKSLVIRSGFLGYEHKE